MLVNVSSEAFQSPAAYAAFCQWMLEGIVALDVGEVERGLVPPLYSSGVRYTDPISGGEFSDALSVLRSGSASCGPLAAWRVAELRAHGEPAELAFRWEGLLYHARVRRADGRIEDPSRVCGMVGPEALFQ